jgi:hydroxyethylthiazole kinase-like sugar kinase family protein
MKKFLILLPLICMAMMASAQNPQGITFQAVARDPSGNAARLRQVFVIDRVISGSASGPVAWEESHTVTTNGEGVFTIVVGRGTRVSGTAAAFNNIRWDLSTYFFNVRVAVAPSLPAPTWTAAANGNHSILECTLCHGIWF